MSPDCGGGGRAIQVLAKRGEMSILRYNLSQRPTGSAEKTDDIAGSPLQELLSAQSAVLIGLIAHLAGTPLPDDNRRRHPRRGPRSPRPDCGADLIDHETFAKIHDFHDRARRATLP
jgi:hypothetical protein